LADSADDYDRMVMVSHSNRVWLRFMAYFMDQGEIAKAKAVGERALKTINVREENERLNVWTALLNLKI
jgi:rRNA biogenesis protein RRP5